MKTSITTAQARKFADTAAQDKELYCSNIAGFHLRKNSKGASWRLKYMDATKKRRRLTIGGYPALHPQEAAQIAIDWRTSVAKGESDPLAKRDELAAQKRLQEQEQAQNQYKQTGRFFTDVYEPHLIDNYRSGKEVASKIRNFSFLFDRDMDKITAHDINTWYSRATKAGLKRQSIIGYLGAFKAMLNFAAGTKKGDQNNNPVIQFNPLRDYSLPRPNVQEREQLKQQKERLQSKRDIFTPEIRTGIMRGLSLYAEHLRQQRRNSRKHGKPHLPDLDLVAFPHWFIPFAHIARLTGMRPSDIRSLRWEQMTYNRFNNETTLTFTPPKTEDKGIEPIEVKFPVAGELLELFNQWREQQGNPTSGFMFKSNRTGQQIERKAYLKHWKHVKEKGGLPDDLDFYAFRHNFISTLVKQNYRPLRIAKLVGHADETMIIKHYFHTDNEDMTELASIAAQSWAKAAGGE